LYLKDTQKMIAAGVELMMKTTLHLLGKQGVANLVLALKDVDDDKNDKDGRNHACGDLGGSA
jgi:hypothetical protein